MQDAQRADYPAMNSFKSSSLRAGISRSKFSAFLSSELVAAVTTVAFANVAAFANFATTAISRPLATINHHARLPSVGAPRPNANSVSEIAGDPLDNAREGDGTIYGYRV